MNIVTIYQTSKGYFPTFEIASQKKNRVKIDNPYSNDYGMRENVKTIKAIVHEGEYYFLEKINIQSN